MTEIENTIRERAYHLWVAGGRRDGEADRHWLTAERELIAEAVTPIAAKVAKTRATGPKTKPKKQRAA